MGRTLLTHWFGTDSRRTYAAVLLGANNITSVAERLEITVKATGKAINRLLASGLVTYADGILRASDAPWTNAVSTRRRERRNFTDSELESPDLLSRIAGMFVRGRSYSEAMVSEMCGAVSPDHARLRRKLVDDGYLTRAGNRYERSVSEE